MKAFISMLVLTLAVAFSVSAFAGDAAMAKTQADCEKAGGKWDAQTSKCSAGKM